MCVSGVCRALTILGAFMLYSLNLFLEGFTTTPASFLLKGCGLQTASSCTVFVCCVTYQSLAENIEDVQTACVDFKIMAWSRLLTRIQWPSLLVSFWCSPVASPTTYCANRLGFSPKKKIDSAVLTSNIGSPEKSCKPPCSCCVWCSLSICLWGEKF